MRVQLFGHPVPRSIVVLAMLEAGTVFGALMAARVLRVHFNPHAIDYDIGSIWARGMLLASATFVCAMAFGLYSGRQRGGTGGILARLRPTAGAAVAIDFMVLYFIRICG